MPDTSPSHGYRVSGRKALSSASAATPSASTDAVCMTATAMPTPTACRTLAPELTMYAAIRVFPCPGSRACQAPNATASSSARPTSGRPSFDRRPAKGPPSTPGRAPTAPASAPQLEVAVASEEPGATSKVAAVTVSGLASSSCG